MDHLNNKNETNGVCCPFETNTCGTQHKMSKDDAYRTRILAAARELFQEHGFQDVNMYQIAQAAGVGQGTLYRRYNHVGAVCMDLLKSNADEFLLSLENRLSSDLKDMPALDRLKHVIDSLVDFMDNKAVLLSVIKCSYSKDLHLMQFKQPIYQRLHILVRTLLQQSLEKNETEKFEPTLTANAFLSAISPDLYLHQREGLGYSKEEISSGLQRLFVVGLKKH